MFSLRTSLPRKDILQDYLLCGDVIFKRSPSLFCTSICVCQSCLCKTGSEMKLNAFSTFVCALQSRLCRTGSGAMTSAFHLFICVLSRRQCRTGSGVVANAFPCASEPAQTSVLDEL